MRVLLTGASGFVGSHILDSLRARDIPAVVLLRASSDRRFLESHGNGVQVVTGSIGEPASLNASLAGVTHVIHCAGCTRAKRTKEFYDVNHIGTQNVVRAANEHRGQVCRLVHISSLAVSGPATAERPARENDSPNPISDYGKSKLAAEVAVKEGAKVPFTILRPPAVYGPRDYGFLTMFKAVRQHLLPRPSAKQALSLVFVKDLADAVVACLEPSVAEGRTYFVAGKEVVSGRQMADQIASQMGGWTIPVHMPALVVWPVCLAQELFSRITGKAMLLNMQKYAELRAPGWVCDPSRLRDEVRFECNTGLKDGIATTLAWYRANKWL
jgi:dihydroflavonol-4-reductase